MSKAVQKLILRIGDKKSLTKVFGKEEVSTFAALSTDNNPVHLDEAFAATTRFKRPLIHGLLVASLISSVVGTELPGPGSIYLKQELNFVLPAYVGDTIRAEVEVIGTQGSKIFLQSKCTAICSITKKETVVIQGPATIYHPNFVLVDAGGATSSTTQPKSKL
eukprot:gene14349-16931_t